MIGLGLGDRLGRHGDGIVAPDLLPQLPVVHVDTVRISLGRGREPCQLLLGLLIAASLLKLLLERFQAQGSGGLAGRNRLFPLVREPALELEQLVTLGAFGLEVRLQPVGPTVALRLLPASRA